MKGMLWILIGAVGADVISSHGEMVGRISRGKSLQASSNCAVYRCADEQLEGLTCVLYSPSENSYQLQPCPAGYFCPSSLQPEVSLTCIPSFNSTKSTYPGSPCLSSSDCPRLNTCNSKGICEGGKQGAICSVESGCDSGYVCYRPGSQHYCNKQADFGEPCRGYIDDTICRNDAVCGLYTCVPWFSLPNGAYTISAYAAYACESGFYQVIPGRSDIVMCAKAPSSPVGLLPRLCAAGSLCFSSDGHYSASCQCGLNSSGFAYCPLFPGDDLYQSYLTVLKEYSSYLANCAFIAIGQMACGAPDQLWQALQSKHQEVEQWGMDQDNDACVTEIFIAN